MTANPSHAYSSLSSFIMATHEYDKPVRPHHLSAFQPSRSPFPSGRHSPPILQDSTRHFQDRPARTGERLEAVGQGLRCEAPTPPSLRSRGEEQALTTGSDKPVAKNALTILINISKDPDVLGLLAEDDAFIETLLVRITVCQLPCSSLFLTLAPPSSRSLMHLTT